MANCSSAISPEVVGNLFVEQYYHFLHTSPDVVHKFYHDQSVLSRPDSNGLMSSATTMQVSTNLFFFQFYIKVLDELVLLKY